MTMYPSKLGLELILPLAGILGSVFLIMAFSGSWIGLPVILCTAAFIGHLFLTTRYQIDGNTLHVKSGFLFEETIAIDTITRITETRNPISSPATSLDRLEIAYKKFDAVLVSPKDKAGFIAHLIRLNPAIDVRLKKP